MHFISYSSIDGKVFALKLTDALTGGQPRFPAWLDIRQLKPGTDWDDQLADAIGTCATLIFVMTPDSVAAGSVCKNEWSRALRCKKPIIPLRVHPNIDIPFRLENRQYLDFTGDFEAGLARLRTHLGWLNSPEGELKQLQYRLADAQRDLRRATPQTAVRIQEEIDLLTQQIRQRETQLQNPEQAARQTEARIQHEIARERQALAAESPARCKFINSPPMLAPHYFQNRYVETRLVGEFLQQPACRLITISGRPGVGKTTMICRLLKSLEQGELPDDGGPLPVDGLVYLCQNGLRQISFANLFADLCKLLPETEALRLTELYKIPQIPPRDKMRALLAAFPTGRVLVLLDNFEDKLDPTNRHLNDPELAEALTALLEAPAHAIKIILTTRFSAHDLAQVEPGREQSLPLDDGLVAPFAENLLREMDPTGTLGLKTAPDDLLAEVRNRTRGFPRALEAFVAILKADRETTLPELLADTAPLLPERVVEKLVGEAFNRLDPAAQRVMLALAIFGRPVPGAAVDFLLQPFFPENDHQPVLNRLVNLQLARKDRGHFYLHPTDRHYALARILPENSFSRPALYCRGADYFKAVRRPKTDWKNLEDLTPQLAEFELRCAAEDRDAAAEVLLEIDFDYLLRWGHYRLAIHLHQRLQGKLADPDLVRHSVGNLGTAFLNVGKVRQAIACYTQALENAREQKNRWGESAWLGNLGLCYSALGEVPKAIKFHEAALKIHQEIGDRRGEATNLGNLGGCYSGLGQVPKAIDFHEAALKIDQEIGDRRGEAADIGNLGLCYSALGQVPKAIDFHEAALKIDQEIGDRRGEAAALGNLGNRYSALGEVQKAIEFYEAALKIHQEIGDRRGAAQDLDNLGAALAEQGNFKEAQTHFNQAIQIADEIQFCQTQNEARVDLARFQLLQGQLASTCATIEAALKYEYPPNQPNTQVLHGVILLRLGEPAEAVFQSAVAAAEKLLKLTPQNYKALDAKGLALCGLAVAGKPEKVESALAAFRAARQITRAAGIVARVRRLFNELLPADSGGILAPVGLEFETNGEG